MTSPFATAVFGKACVSLSRHVRGEHCLVQPLDLRVFKKLFIASVHCGAMTTLISRQRKELSRSQWRTYTVPADPALQGTPPGPNALP